MNTHIFSNFIYANIIYYFLFLVSVVVNHQPSRINLIILPLVLSNIHSKLNRHTKKNFCSCLRSFLSSHNNCEKGAVKILKYYNLNILASHYESSVLYNSTSTEDLMNIIVCIMLLKLWIGGWFEGETLLLHRMRRYMFALVARRKGGDTYPLILHLWPIILYRCCAVETLRRTPVKGHTHTHYIKSYIYRCVFVSRRALYTHSRALDPHRTSALVARYITIILFIQRV